MRRRIWIGGAFAGIALAMTSLASLQVRAQDETLPIVPGQSAEESITDRFGDEWRVYACAGDVLSAVVEGDGFTPYLEAYAQVDEAPIAEVDGEDGIATLDGLEVEESGFYTLIVGGEQRSDRGDYIVTLSEDGAVEAEPPDDWMPYGRILTGSVRSRNGEIWQAHACEGQSLTVVVSSDAFVPYIEIATLDYEEVLADAEGEESVAALEGFEVPDTGDYWIVIGGAERSDRGPYEIWILSDAMQVGDDGVVTAIGGSPEETPTRRPGGLSPSTRTPMRTPTRTPTRRPTATRTATSTPAPSAPLCVVQVQGLNLRSGPGTVFNPPIGAIALGAQVEILGRDAGGGWIEVEVSDTSRRGWVNSASQYVTCNVAISSVPLAAVIPVAPTATPTSTPTATPTNTPRPAEPPPPPAQVIVPAPGGGAEDLGTLGIDPNMGRRESGRTVFTRRMFMRLEPNQGSGIDRVEFRVSGDDGQVHFTTEEDYPFCMFGDSGGQCAVLELRGGARWIDEEDGQPEVRNGLYNVVAVAFDGDDNRLGDWAAEICIDSDDLPNSGFDCGEGGGEGNGGERLPLEIFLEEVAPGRTDGADGTVTIRVYARDPSSGGSAGDGIDQVYMELFDPNGTRVHDRPEGTYGFCLFGGGEPDCTPYSYADNGGFWESGVEFAPGAYMLRVTVTADDGRTQQQQFFFNLN